MASQLYIHTTCINGGWVNKHQGLSGGRGRRSTGFIRVSNGGESYLDMWRKAVDGNRKGGSGSGSEELERKSSEFLKILQVSTEERDRIQRMQVIDRAAAAIDVARTLLNHNHPLPLQPHNSNTDTEDIVIGGDPGSAAIGIGTPGPNFWSWIPPLPKSDDGGDSKASGRTFPFPSQPNPVVELEPYIDHLSLPFQSSYDPPLPPLQSFMEVEKQDAPDSISASPQLRDDQFPRHAEQAAYALAQVNSESCEGSGPDGSRWWKETGTQVRPDGVVCRWTLTRGVSADKTVEWEDKYWEAADEFDYKELGSLKSGRDAAGNVWREFWKESMSQIEGCLHIEKTADKWGKNGKGDEWQEKWFEHYGGGQTEKWAHKWCSVDPSTRLEVGHAHVWHERWGEKYDGQGGSEKYTDKWAERWEEDGWTKWGDKWDEHFDRDGHGVKQGETWWEGKRGERWNRTWGEGHNGSGWVHKYGRSSSGEHWDTYVEQDTWYERHPHYSFNHCFENSQHLRRVKKPSQTKP